MSISRLLRHVVVFLALGVACLAQGVRYDSVATKLNGIGALAPAASASVTVCSPVYVAAAPTGASELAGSVTITTTANHGFSQGQSVTVSGVGIVGYNGTWTITSVPTPTTFTYQDTTTGLGTSGGGLATNVPCTNTVTIYSDPLLQNSVANPVTSDALGNFGFYYSLAPMVYTVTGSGIGGQAYSVVSFPPTGTGTFALGSLSVTKSVRDCRQDGVLADGTTDDAAALNLCLANAFSGGQDVQLPSGKIKVNSAVNNTNHPGMNVSGVGANEDYSTAVTGQDFGTAITQVLCNTAAACWDNTGSGHMKLAHIALRTQGSYSAPSTFGFLFGRDNAVSGSGWSTGAGTYCFVNDIVMDHDAAYFDTAPAATAVGTVAIYNVGAEQFSILGGLYIADQPGFFSANNTLSLASPYQTLKTGCAASMTDVTIDEGSTFQAWTKSAFDFRDVGDLWMSPNTELLNGLQGTNHNAAIVFNTSSTNTPTNNILSGSAEKFDYAVNINNAVDRLKVRFNVVAPTAGLILVGTGKTVSAAEFNMEQVSGSTQPLFNASSGTATITGSLLHEYSLSGSGTCPNLTITGSTIYAPGLADAVVNTCNAASTYEVMDSTGNGMVGTSNLRGHLIWPTDATYDIGANNATRPRNLYLGGLVAQYNGLTLLHSGVPSNVAAQDLTAQTAATGTITLYAVPAAGQFRLSWNAKVTTPATTGAATSTLGPLTIVYTDPDGVAQTITAAAQIAAGTIATNSTGNTTTTVLLGVPMMLNCKTGTNITYSMAYASNTAAQMQYNLHIILEAQ